MSEQKYADAGVDYGVMDPAKLAAQRAAATTAAALIPRNVFCVDESRGESAFVLDVGAHYLTFVTEALGTKNIVADALRTLSPERTFYDLIARDTVATILNDLCTVGGEPLSIAAYWAAGSSAWFGDEQRMFDLVSGWTQACMGAGVAWGGGETQALDTIIAPDRAVLGGAAIGIVRPKERLLHAQRLALGDAILVAPATGIHANGLTLARAIGGRLPQGLQTIVSADPRSRTLGEVLLDPAPLYGPLVEHLQRSGVDLHYAAHITGHGWRKLMRAAQGLTYVVDRLPAVPPIFQFLQQAGELSDADMYGTFNMGGGFALFVDPQAVVAAQTIGRDLGLPLDLVGHVEAGPRQVVLRPISVTFSAETLRIRLEERGA